MPIIDPLTNNPLVDGRQSPNALMIRQGVERKMQNFGNSFLAELTLDTGRRCDLICLSPKGKFIIVEVKSSVEDYRVDTKWHEYKNFCDTFYFATHAGVSPSIFPKNEGLIIADEYGAEIVREAGSHPLNAAARKKLLVRYASTATNRLRLVNRYADKAGIDVDFTELE